ncbi:ASYMMETRIC LEAVES2-LIKE 18, lateral organ boundaries-domain 16 [Hibiscus trionum]|uniref:ASYMMETRIC LEAVES2-LIKE 18, lateral organ boundaries-domain 16 n=1 Tax=Hibiscus trionum TaxID=183268 RepID=A0A9W7LS16_HIBTR|nr:ASYMMETRIC LEAVES2-LIKE 18, lateral organ boundaries-domain 16 [Hibiscus trionum]
MASPSGTATGTGSHCGACKFLRRKCPSDCVFAPYFCSEQGPARFAAIHKVFGASNVSKLLQNIPAHDRCEAIITVAYEAEARIRDPVYGCVAQIFALQQQVACLQAQLMQLKGQVAQNNAVNSSHNTEESQRQGNYLYGVPCIPSYHMNPISPQSSLESVELNSGESMNLQETQSRDEEFCNLNFPEKMISYNNGDLGELQALALRMMRN